MPCLADMCTSTSTEFVVIFTLSAFLSCMIISRTIFRNISMLLADTVYSMPCPLSFVYILVVCRRNLVILGPNQSPSCFGQHKTTNCIKSACKKQLHESSLSESFSSLICWCIDFTLIQPDAERTFLLEVKPI